MYSIEKSKLIAKQWIAYHVSSNQINSEITRKKILDPNNNLTHDIELKKRQLKNENENIEALEFLDDLIRAKDERLVWIIFKEIWKNIDINDWFVKGAFGAGPMEDFMRQFSDQYIDDVIVWAKSDEYFKRILLECVWGKETWSENAKYKMKIYFNECMAKSDC